MGDISFGSGCCMTWEGFAASKQHQVGTRSSSGGVTKTFGICSPSSTPGLLWALSTDNIK